MRAWTGAARAASSSGSAAGPRARFHAFRTEPSRNSRQMMLLLETCESCR